MSVIDEGSRTRSPEPDTPPVYPMPRECPFDPPSALRELQQSERESRRPTRVRIWDGSTPWLITDYAAIRSTLADPRFSNDPRRPGYPSSSPARQARARARQISLLFLDDPEHARQRRMLRDEFNVRRVDALQPLIVRGIDELLDAMAAGPPEADLVQGFALPLPSLVICHLLGVPYEDHEFFQTLGNQILDNSLDEATVIAAGDTLNAYLAELITRRRSEPADDLLSRLAGRLDTDELDLDTAVTIAFLLLIAGHETTANMIALGTLRLLTEPDLAAAVRAGDDAVARRVVDELMRVLTIAHIGRRRVAIEDAEIAGTPIAAGEGVILASEIANRDPELFPEPDRIDPDRSSNRHVAFGSGIHGCIGQSLARRELQLAYPALLRRFPDLQVAVGLDELPFRHTMAFYGVDALPVRWSASRSPSTPP